MAKKTTAVVIPIEEVTAEEVKPTLLPVIAEVVEKSGLQVTAAQSIAFKFMPIINDINELSKDLMTINKEAPTKEDAALARKNRLALVKKRSEAKELKAEEKETLLLQTKHIDSLFNLVESTAQLNEKDYEKIEKFEINRIIEERKKLTEERSEILKPYNVNTAFYDLANMQEHEFDELVDMFDRAAKQKIEEARLAEEKRITDEKAAEEKRIADEKANTELLKKQQAENKKLLEEKEKARLEALKQAEILKQAKLKADKKLADEQAKNKQIQANLEAKNKEAADKQKALQEELDLASHHQRQYEIKQRAKQEAILNGTDKVKVRALFDQIKAIDIPQMESETGKRIEEEVTGAIELIKQFIIKQSKKLL